MTETLMTPEASTPTEGQAASTPDTQAATAAVEVVQQQATEGQQAQAPAQAQAAEPEVKPQGAPEKYEFQPIEGSSVTPEVMERFSGVAKDLNLSQEAAQKVLSEMAPAIQAHQQKQLAALTKGWADQSTVDPEFGGEKLQENLTVAKKALEAFGTPQLRALFNESGLGNHPEVIRFMVRAGKAVSEDKFVSGAAHQSQQSAVSMYPASKMNP